MINSYKTKYVNINYIILSKRIIILSVVYNEE